MSDEEKKEKWSRPGELNPNYGIRWRCLSKNSKFINYQLDNSPFIAGEDS